MVRSFGVRVRVCGHELVCILQGSTRSMAFLMLDKVLAPELIAGVVESSVSPYALEHRLDLDRVLLDYIKVLTFSFPPTSNCSIGYLRILLTSSHFQ